MQIIHIVLMITITIALTLTLSITSVTNNDIESTQFMENAHYKVGAGKRVSRFLQERNPRAADHCTRDNQVCQYAIQGTNSTCCNNKCMDLSTDDKNCGACKRKCEYTETCCRGQCVDLAFDKRHCGYCNNRCNLGSLCFYGTCDYA